MPVHLIIAALAFVLTLGGLFLTETYKANKTSQQDYAQIIKTLNEGKTKDQSKTPAPTVTPTPILTPSRTPTPMFAQSSPTAGQTSSPTPARTPTPAPILINSSPSPTSIPSETPLATDETFVQISVVPEISTPTPTPTLTATPVSGHIFYTSSRSNSKKYYCDTDNEWKNLSQNYLKQYSSEAELLEDYPNKTLSKPCKN